MKLLPKLHGLTLFWRLYFGILYLAFAVLFCLTCYLLITDGGTDSGIADVYAIFYLIIFAIFVALSAAIYNLGDRHGYIRLVFAASIIVGGLAFAGAFLLNAYIKNQYETKYRPLTRMEALELIRSCRVITIAVGSPRYSDITLNTVDNQDRTTNRFSADEYEEELRSALAASNC